MLPLLALTALVVSSSDAGQPAFETPRAAMAAAAVAAKAVSDDFESGGALYQTADGYHFTLPVTARNERGVDYSVRLPAGARLVALYHTHVLEANALEFSDSDKKLQHTVKLPMYVFAIRYNRVIAIGAEPFKLERQ